MIQIQFDLCDKSKTFLFLIKRGVLIRTTPQQNVCMFGGSFKFLETKYSDMFVRNLKSGGCFVMCALNL